MFGFSVLCPELADKLIHQEVDIDFAFSDEHGLLHLQEKWEDFTRWKQVAATAVSDEV